MKMYLEGATNGFLAAHDRLHDAARVTHDGCTTGVHRPATSRPAWMRSLEFLVL